MSLFRMMAFLLFLAGFAGCTVTGVLSRNDYNATVIHTPKQLTENTQDLRQENISPQVSDQASGSVFVPRTTFENGEQVMNMEIEKITIVAKSRSMPERMGKVTLDFVITLPKKLQGTCRSVVITPVLHRQGQKKYLEGVTIRGGLFYKVQQRDYWQYNRYLEVYDPDEKRALAAFHKFVKFPYPEGVRLDSIVEHATDLSYHYTQTVPATEAGKRLRITLEGKIIGLDESFYQLPPSDTLDYVISSMLSFIDTTQRLKTRIVEKYATIQDRRFLTFRVNDTRIIDTLGDNQSQLAHIASLLDRIVIQGEYFVDSIVLTAYSSPEGGYALNDRLARLRSHALRDYLVERFPSAEISPIITVRWVPEAWEELKSQINADTIIRQRQQLLHIINKNPDPDRRETEIKKCCPEDYRYLRQSIYPLLRSVSITYNLRRKGMIRDTIHTQELDTLYARGTKLLEERRYADALQILSPYNDLNTAIALLSLGMDERAYHILNALPTSAVTAYLKAITLSRLGDRQRAIECYDQACRLDNNLKYRGNLDPEISTLKE